MLSRWLPNRGIYHACLIQTRARVERIHIMWFICWYGHALAHGIIMHWLISHVLSGKWNGHVMTNGIIMHWLILHDVSREMKWTCIGTWYNYALMILHVSGKCNDLIMLWKMCIKDMILYWVMGRRSYNYYGKTFPFYLNSWKTLVLEVGYLL